MDEEIADRSAKIFPAKDRDMMIPTLPINHPTLVGNFGFKEATLLGEAREVNEAWGRSCRQG